MKQKVHQYLYLLLATLLLALVGCSADFAPKTSLTLTPEERIASASHFLKQAETAVPPLSNQYRLQASEQLIKAGQIPYATRILREVLATAEDESFRKQILEIFLHGRRKKRLDFKTAK